MSKLFQLQKYLGVGIDNVEHHVRFLKRPQHPRALQALQFPPQGANGDIQSFGETSEVKAIVRMREDVLKEGTPDPGRNQRFKHRCTPSAHKQTQKGHNQYK